MARDKEYELRMSGMIFALNVAKQKGIEELEKEIKKRNLLRVPMYFTQKQIDEFWDQLSLNIYNNMLTATCFTLNQAFGFGEKRIRAFKEAYDKVVDNALDLDYLGCNYVKLEDYAVELNEKFDMGIDVARVAMCQDAYNDTNDRFHKIKAERVIEELEAAGFSDAAEYVKNKIA